MNEEMLDILIGKYLDSEITPAEQRLLDAALEANAEALRRLAAMRALHEATAEALSAAGERGRAPEEVFAAAEAAFEGRARRVAGRRRIVAAAMMAVAAVAGFVVGAAVYGLLTRPGTPAMSRPEPEGMPMAAQREPDINASERRESATVATAEPGETIREATERRLREVRPAEAWGPTGWPTIYSFQDAGGREWLVETYPESQGSAVQTAAYHGDL